MDILQKLATEFNLKLENVTNTVELIDADNTIPFIARYRKELTGSLDDQVLRDLHERLLYLRGLEKRKSEIISSIETQGKLTEELQKSIEAAVTLTEAEDLYRPYKPKRKTRASVAREKGLEPLAEIILTQSNNTNCMEVAKDYITENVPTEQDAINGAMDIIAEDLSDRADVRKQLRALFMRVGKIVTKATDVEEETVYQMYYDFNEPLIKILNHGHRVLAIDRGEKESKLKVSLEIPTDEAIAIIDKNMLKGNNECTSIVKKACDDSYSRLIYPSLEREIRSFLTERAVTPAIKVFADNLRQLLLQPPVKGNVTLGLDPGFRTGCKVALVDDTGKVLDTGVIYPTNGKHKLEEANIFIKNLIKKHSVTIISIGNGTASRETENFVADLLKTIDQKVSYMVVSEAGASVYSASPLAAKEFPQFDVTIRGAISIARRIQDPLAELVKIDPKSIGVGQYQHDMPKGQLDEALGGVVESCVNQVGVDLNTASQPLLARVSGINSTVAKNIVEYREENGAFTNRKQLMKVAKLGAKAFTQSAGFLRVASGDNILDNTGVHPESYKSAGEILKICGYDAKQLKSNSNITFVDIKQKAQEVGISQICEQLELGEPTVVDILDELAKPGRDPRDELPKPLLRSDVLELKDLTVGMELKGTVRNIIDFGAFVDIGVHDDGLVHISQICDKFIKHPLDVLKVGDIVTVWVISIDIAKKRIGLTMLKPKSE